MNCEAFTYSAHVTDYSVGASAPQILGRFSSQGSVAPAHVPLCLPQGLAGFLLRLVAYFQGARDSLPRMDYPVEASLTVIDTYLDAGDEPLQIVRMNRHLSRRLRWLIRRGRVQRSGEIRLATEEDKAQCNLTPGQLNEYCIRVHRLSRVRVYGLNRGVSVPRETGGVGSFGLAAMCNAIITPE